MGSAAQRAARGPLADLLRHPRFEVLPLDGIEEQVVAHLGTDIEGHRHRLAAQGARGHARAERAALAAPATRSCRTCRRGSCATAPTSTRCSPGCRRGHPRAVRAGRRRHRAGRVPERRRAARGDGRGAHAVRRDRHHRLPREPPPDLATRRPSARCSSKAPMATYIVSQICFDPATIAAGSARCAPAATSLPIWIGLPGCVDHAKLRADLDEDRPRRVGALPAPPPRLGVAAPDAAVHARQLLRGLAPVVDGARRRRRRLPPLHVQRGGVARSAGGSGRLLV